MPAQRTQLPLAGGAGEGRDLLAWFMRTSETVSVPAAAIRDHYAGGSGTASGESLQVAGVGQ